MYEPGTVKIKKKKRIEVIPTIGSKWNREVFQVKRTAFIKVLKWTF